MLAGLKPRVFIASSTEGLDVAYSLQRNLEDATAPTVWRQGVFQPSSIILDQLLTSVGSFQFGVFVFSPDDVVHMRGDKYSAPRDNVVFELGLFIGRLGRERNFVVVPSGTPDLRLPSDLLGLTAVSYDASRPVAEFEAALGPAAHSIRSAIFRIAAAEASGGDPRHENAFVLYTSRVNANLTDFVATGSRFYGESPDKPKGVGLFRIQENVLVVERSNRAGRYLLTLRQYRTPSGSGEFVPKNETLTGQRLVRLTAEVKSTRGERKVIFVLKNQGSDDRLVQHHEVVRKNEWQAVDAVLRCSPFDDFYLRIEDQDVSESPSALHIRNLVLSEPKRM